MVLGHSRIQNMKSGHQIKIETRSRHAKSGQQRNRATDNRPAMRHDDASKPLSASGKPFPPPAAIAHRRCDGGFAPHGLTHRRPIDGSTTPFPASTSRAAETGKRALRPSLAQCRTPRAFYNPSRAFCRPQVRSYGTRAARCSGMSRLACAGLVRCTHHSAAAARGFCRRSGPRQNPAADNPPRGQRTTPPQPSQSSLDDRSRTRFV